MKKLAILTLLMAALFALAAYATNAAELPLIDFAAKILNIDGSEIPAGPADKSPITLGKVSQDALVANIPGDAPNASEKGDRFRLAMKIQTGKEPLTTAEVELLKKVLGLAYGPLVYGRALELLPR